MRRIPTRILFPLVAVLFVTAFLPWKAIGQRPPIAQMPLHPHEMEELQRAALEHRQSPDTSRKRERRPLRSYLFDDSTKKQVIFIWNVDTYRNGVRMVPVDTAMSGRQLNYPFIGSTVGHAYQGNMGGASIPLSYFERPRYSNFDFGQGFDTYHFFPESVRFFNVKKPFTQFSYYSAGRSSNLEEGLYLTHAQNISPSTGFNLDYHSVGLRQYYSWSKGRAKNLSLAFNHTGRNYTVHAGYVYNTINNKENGGVTHERHITDTIYELPVNVPVRLRDARNVIKGNTFYLVQSYGFPLRKMKEGESTIASQSSIFVGHSSTYSRWKKMYSDTRPGTIWTEAVTDDEGNPVTEYHSFYDNWFIHPGATYDSISETLLSNRAFVQIQPFDRDGIIGLIDAGAGVDHHTYYNFETRDYIGGVNKGTTTTDYYLYGALQGKFRKYLDWSADLRFHPVGDRSGDLYIGAKAAGNVFIREKPITLAGEFSNDLRSPTHWTERMISNHFIWSNSFAKENETRLKLTLSVPSLALELGAMQSVVTDKIYYDAHALPAQHSGSVSVSGLYADKDFRLGGFHLRHRVLLQWSTQEEVIPVPLASAFLSYYFEFDVVKDVLRAQVGVDARYNTEYYAFGWMPSTAQFYNQRERKVGGYPLLDVYITGKWKRMRILLKMEHVNEDLFGPRNYFTLLRYPLAKRVFKFGFSWNFYD